MLNMILFISVSVSELFSLSRGTAVWYYSVTSVDTSLDLLALHTRVFTSKAPLSASHIFHLKRKRCDSCAIPTNGVATAENETLFSDNSNVRTGRKLCCMRGPCAPYQESRILNFKMKMLHGGLYLVMDNAEKSWNLIVLFSD